MSIPLSGQADIIDNKKQAWSLEQWLSYLQAIHPSEIDLGLERVQAVFNQLSISFAPCQVITVAGTNGKGTTCALIEQAILCSEQTVGVFSSPHIIDYRERVRINGDMLGHRAHCEAFLAIEQARQDIPLTYFEFGTLAALYLLEQQQVEYVLLEVGLGGRLDAVNIVDPDIAVITGIALDHQDWLGHTREKIATEKAGIFRPKIPAVIGEPAPPETLHQAAKDYQVRAFWQGDDFSYQLKSDGFSWQSAEFCYQNLPIPHIPAQNASTALQVIKLLKLGLTYQQMQNVFEISALPGRRQVLQNSPLVMLDVAHNPQATGLLAAELKAQNYQQVIAVVAMLGDKDISASLAPMQEVVDVWHCSQLDVSRAAKVEQLVTVLSAQKKVLEFSSVKQAYNAAIALASDESCVICFGSFFTVAEILKLQ